MKNLLRLFLLASISFAFLPVSAQTKNRIKFNDNWKFLLDSVNQYNQPAVDDASWRTLDLPHDWSIEMPFEANSPTGNGGGALRGGMGWYRKSFTLPASQKDKLTFIEFDGVYRKSEVWINGHYLGKRPNGYISFQYDLSPYLKYGSEKNIIAVKVDNLDQPNSRWYSGSGIYRNVWLTTVNKVHVDHWGTCVTTSEVSEKFATISIETKISNNYEDSADVALTNSLYDANGKIITKAISRMHQVAKSLAGLRQDLPLHNPNLWSVDRPYLYKIVSEVSVKGKVVDTYETRFGVRYFNFDSDRGFLLNGKQVKILGVCDHHDLGCLGTAINKAALRRQLQILKDMGCNGIRTSHNPPAPELLDLCDEMGFIVMDEAFDMWKVPKTKYDYHLDWDQWHKTDLEDQIVRDRNHPSVFIWSIGNEVMEQWEKDESLGINITKELVAIVKSLDTTRPTVSATNGPNPGNPLYKANALDLVGYNYDHRNFGGFQQRFPGKKFIGTETTSAIQSRGHYDMPSDSIRRWPERWDKPFDQGNPDTTCSAYDNCSTPWGSTHEESWKEIKKYDFLSGMYIWTGFDYIGEPTPYPWPARSSYFGIIDLAGFPKDVYYMYQSEWTNKPVLHIFPHWNWKPGDTIDVWAYYNHADEVELFLNGRSLGVKKKMGDDLHIMWRVKYEPGVIKAVSKLNGKVVLTKEVRTAGAPARIVLRADRAKIKADGNDLSFITATVVDKDGITVPDASNLISFFVSGNGSIAGVDNGCETDLSSFKSNKHKAFNGLCLAVIKSKPAKGTIRVAASSNGLPTTTIDVVAQ